MKIKFLSKLLFLGLIPLSCACSNDSEPIENISFSIDYTLMESGSMSRGGEDVYSRFYNEMVKTKKIAPENYSLKFSTLDSEHQVMSVNGTWSEKNSIILPSGTYNVTGTSHPTTQSNCDSLYIVFDEAVQITSAMTKLMLKAKYDCYLLLFSTENITKVEATQANTTSLFNLPKTNEVFYLFVNYIPYSSISNNRVLDIFITKNDGNKIVINLSKLGLEKGKYYYFNDVTNTFDIDPMENGNE